MAVTAVNNTATNGTAASSSATSAAEIGDRFLKLLVTQLKNQDPMNPMENAELTSQLAQLSTVEGISKMNASMTSLAAQFQATQMLQGASLIGHSVLAEGSTLTLSSAGAAGGVNLDSAADTVQVSIRNDSGTTVRTLTLGPQEAGLAQFAWDGKDTAGNALQQGNYSFKVTATADGKSVEATAYALQQVQSVTATPTGLNLDLTHLGALGLDKIKQIF